MPAHFLWILLVALALVVGLAVLGAVQARKRRAALGAWARAQGFAFSPGRDPGMERRLPHHECLQEGSNRYAENVMRGERDGRAVLAFDYHYQTTSTGSKGRRRTHHHHFSAVAVDAGLRLRPLAIRPENALDRIAEFVGFDDIDFESARFSREFHVQGHDQKWAFDVIHQETIEFLLSAPRFTLEMGGRWIVARRRARFQPGDFGAAIGVAAGILDRLPRYLRRQLKGEDA